MKALLLAAALATLSTAALAGAAVRDERRLASGDKPATLVMADAGRLGSAGLTALHDSRWAPAGQRRDADAAFNDTTAEIDTGPLVIALGVLALLLYRPLGRALRRQAQQRRAAALASTLHGRAGN